MQQFFSCFATVVADVGPDTVEPGKFSTDLYNDSVFRFLARVHSYVINRARNKTIKERHARTPAIMLVLQVFQQNVLLDKYDQTFSRKLITRIETERERERECKITKNMNSLNTCRNFKEMNFNCANWSRT